MAQGLLGGLLTRGRREVVRTLDRVLSTNPQSSKYTPSVPEIAQLLRATGPDLHAVCCAADALREQACGEEVSYVVNRNINFTNVCVKRCRFCAFSRTGTSQQGYALPLEEIVARASEAADLGATEVCVQAGLPPNLKPGFYQEIARAIKAARPQLHLHSFSPEEVLYGARREGSSVEAFLRSLQEAGVDTLPGTSAEILGDDSLRCRLAPGRLSTEDWIGVVRTAHGIGLRTTSTMMYGHLETPEHVAKHLTLLRDIQAATGGFTEFVPLGFVAAEAPGNLKGTLGPDLRQGPTGVEVLRTHAVARIVLHGAIDNIQASWVKEGVKLAQLLLGAGCNDLGGTLINESISTSAGAQHGQLLRPREMQELIRSCGRAPYERLTTYERRSADGGAGAQQGHGLDGAGAAGFGSYHDLIASPKFRFAATKPAPGRSRPTAATGPPGVQGMATLAVPQHREEARPGARGVVTFSPSITIVPTYQCFNACSYCNFRQAAQGTSSEWLTVEGARRQLESAPPDTVEVLVMSGEIHPKLTKLRREWIHRVVDLCALAKSMGFMPHTNVGPLSREEFEALRAVNFSMGLMLEQTGAPLPVHKHAPSKRPGVRAENIALAGELQIPFTTGILCGIGETHEQRLASLEEISELHRRYGHIQECIVQPHSVGQKQRAEVEGFQMGDLPALVEDARSILPPDVRIQVPPNLVRAGGGLLGRCVEAGARDLGGISLVNKDEVNPDFPFPTLAALRAELREAGFGLEERLPVEDGLARRLLPEDMRAEFERHATGLAARKGLGLGLSLEGPPLTRRRLEASAASAA